MIKTGSDFCLSLAEGDAIETKTVKIGGQTFDLKIYTPQFNAALGVGGELRWQSAEGKLPADQDFSGSKIALGGLSYSFTVNVRF